LPNYLKSGFRIINKRIKKRYSSTGNVGIANTKIEASN